VPRSSSGLSHCEYTYAPKPNAEAASPATSADNNNHTHAQFLVGSQTSRGALSWEIIARTREIGLPRSRWRHSWPNSDTRRYCHRVAAAIRARFSATRTSNEATKQQRNRTRKRRTAIASIEACSVNYGLLRRWLRSCISAERDPAALGWGVGIARALERDSINERERERERVDSLKEDSNQEMVSWLDQSAHFGQLLATRGIRNRCRTKGLTRAQREQGSRESERTVPVGEEEEGRE